MNCPHCNNYTKPTDVHGRPRTTCGIRTMSLQSSIDKLSHDIELAQVLEKITGISQLERLAKLQERLSALAAEDAHNKLEGLAIATAWRERMEAKSKAVPIRYLTPLSDSYDAKGKDLGEQRGMFP